MHKEQKHGAVLQQLSKKCSMILIFSLMCIECAHFKQLYVYRQRKPKQSRALHNKIISGQEHIWSFHNKIKKPGF